MASDTGASPVFNSRWWHRRLEEEEEDTLETNRASYPREVFYEKTGPASYLALQDSVTMFDHKVGYCLEVVCISSEGLKHLSKAFIAPTTVLKEISG